MFTIVEESYSYSYKHDLDKLMCVMLCLIYKYPFRY